MEIVTIGEGLATVEENGLDGFFGSLLSVKTEVREIDIWDDADRDR